MGEVIVTFYDNFREEDTSNVSLSTVESGGDGVDIEVFAAAGTWDFSFGYRPTPEDETDMRTVGPFTWNVGAATLEAAIEAAFAVAHPNWVCGVTKVAGVYQVRFGTSDIFDPTPNAYFATDINLSGYFSTVWDEYEYHVFTTPSPDCSTGSDEQETPVGSLAPGDDARGRLEALHAIGGRGHPGDKLGAPLPTPPPMLQP